MFSWFNLLASFSQSLKSAHPTGQAKSDKSFFACLFVLLHLIILQKKYSCGTMVQWWNKMKYIKWLLYLYNIVLQPPLNKTMGCITMVHIQKVVAIPRYDVSYFKNIVLLWINNTVIMTIYILPYLFSSLFFILF